MASRPIEPPEDERDERNDVTMKLPRPICLGCLRCASEMSELDQFILGEGESDTMRPCTGEEREEYIREEEGTYNASNGHFLCDICYMDAGMPTSELPMGWKCP